MKMINSHVVGCLDTKVQILERKQVQSRMMYNIKTIGGGSEGETGWVSENFIKK